MKGPTFSDIPVYAHIFHSGILRLLVFLVFNVFTAIFILTTSNKWEPKKQRAVYEWVNISDDLVYEWVRFFQRPSISWMGRFQNTGSHTYTKIIPELPPPHPPPWGISFTRMSDIVTLPLCLDIVCFPSLLLPVSREDCGSRMWPILGNFIYMLLLKGDIFQDTKCLSGLINSKLITWNYSRTSNQDRSFTMASSNSFLSPYESLPIA